MSVRSFKSSQSRPRSRAGSVGGLTQSRHGSNTKAGVRAGFSSHKGDNVVGVNIKAETWVNCPISKKGEADFFDPCTLKGVSTRRHTTGYKYKLATNQFPADSSFQLCEYEEEPGAPHPSDEVTLRGGNGEPVFIQHLTEDSLMTTACICPGFQLVNVKWFDKESGLQKVESDFKGNPAEIFKDSEGQPLPLPITLCCLSPLAKLPSFSDREIAQKIGIRKIKEVHLKRLEDALGIQWVKIIICTRYDSGQLEEAIDDNLELVSDVHISGGRGMDSQGVKKDALLKTGYKLKPETGSGAKITKSTMDRLKPPFDVYVGVPRSAEKIENVKFSIFDKAVSEAGMHWIEEDHRRILWKAIREIDEEKKSVAGEHADMCWKEELADIFVFDDVRGENAFVHIARPITSKHILAITNRLQVRFKERQEEPGPDDDLNFSDFEKAFVLGGVTWLSRGQIKILYNAISGSDSEKEKDKEKEEAPSGLSLLEWMGRFAWDPNEAVVEVQRHLEDIANENKVEVMNAQMTFEEFQNELFEKKITWLTVEQQELIFNTMDESRDGIVDRSEWEKIVEKRRLLEEKREEEYQQKLKAQKEAEEAQQEGTTPAGDADTADAGEAPE